MSNFVSPRAVKRLAGLELNALLYSKVLPADLFQGVRITSSGTPIYDVNGEVLFYRVPIRKGRKLTAYADIAAHSELGAPLLSVSYGLEWNTKSILKQATTAARKQRRSLQFNRVRFVAYSYPKIAVQFLRNRNEVLMLELYSWRPVPEKRERRPKEPPAHFERWSLLEELPAARKRSGIRKFDKRLKQWDEVCPPGRAPKRFVPERLQVAEFKRVFEPRVITDTRELHYSPDLTDHHPCYELRSQLTGVWCVAASVQMFLDFYRYNYAQTRLAQDLGLGTLQNPNGLPYANVNDVVTVLENLTSNALDATIIANPGWSVFRNEIRANRPLISFVPGHSRTVAGYTSSRIFSWYTFRGLLVYDPWPPSPSTPPTTTTGGVITRWENFDSQTYQYAYTAQLTLV